MATFEQFLSDLLDIAKAHPAFPSPLVGLGHSAHRLQLIGAILASQKGNHRVQERMNLRLREVAYLGQMASVAGLASSFAHELNQPLTAILSSAQAAKRVAADERPDIQQLQELLQDIESNTVRAGKLLRKMYRTMNDTCQSAYYSTTQRSATSKGKRDKLDLDIEQQTKPVPRPSELQ
jgi:signal transduction histidine kinase